MLLGDQYPNVEMETYEGSKSILYPTLEYPIRDSTDEV